MNIVILIIVAVGAFAFGVVMGWITYRTLRRKEGGTGLSDIATVGGAVAGAWVTSLFPAESLAFGAYCIGLAVGFFTYLRTALKLSKEVGETEKVLDWLGTTREVKPDSEASTPSGSGLPPTAGN
jgi:O-antigen/teichoic acid export membrane protein